MTARTSRIDAPNGALAVYDWGGRGDPVLLAHPTGFHGRAWAPMAERLVTAGRRVWSFDFLGHGDSDAPSIDDHDYSWHAFAVDVLAVAADLDLAGHPRLIAAGHSKGAASLLLGEVKQPGAFPRIWAYEPIVFPTTESMPPDADFPLARSARTRRNEWASKEEAFDSYASKPRLGVLTEEALRAYVEYGLRDRGDGVFELNCRPEVEAQVYTMGPNHGAWNLLPNIDAQVLVVCGEMSLDVGPPLATKVADRLPHGRLEIMPGLGHFGPQQDPDRCVASILAFASGT